MSEDTFPYDMADIWLILQIVWFNKLIFEYIVCFYILYAVERERERERERELLLH